MVDAALPDRAGAFLGAAEDGEAAVREPREAAS